MSRLAQDIAASRRAIASIDADRLKSSALRLPGHLAVKPAPTSVPPLPGFTVRDLFGDDRPTPYLCKTVIDQGDLVVVFGDSGTLKSFWVIDLVMHISTGREYCGLRVNATGVLLIAGEGSAGMKRRLKAWMIRHGITESEPQPRIFIATEPADLTYDAGTIRATLEHAEAALGVPIGIVCFDTLAASFGDSDENSTADMNKAIATARQTCGDRAVLFIHHVGHGAKDRERGAYLLRATADTRIQIHRPLDNGPITVTCLKRKDGELFAPMSFAPHVVDTGWVDADGDPVTSLILDRTDYKPATKEPTGARQKTILDLLRHSPLRKSALVSALTSKGFNRTSCYRAIEDLIEAKQIDVGIDEKLRLIEVQS